MATTFDGIINEPTVDFVGKDGFFWWFGEVVEDRDPLQIGRVKVRIWGWYTGLDAKYKEKMPDEDLPWAVVLQPTDQGGQEGTGKSAGQLNPGAMVMGFFLDGQEAQQPVVMGVVRSYKKGSTDGIVESIFGSGGSNDGKYDNTKNEALTNPATGQSVASGQGPATSTQSPVQQVPTAPGQPLNASIANLPNAIVSPDPMPQANGVAGSSNTFENHLKYQLKDIGATIATLVPQGGDFISVVDGTVKNVSALTGKVKNLISGVLSEAVAALKELFVTTMATVIKALKLTAFLGIPFIYTTALQAIIQLVLDYLCNIDSSFLSGVLNALSGTVDSFVESMLGMAFDMIFSLVEDAFNKIIADILCAIETLFSQIQSIIGAVSAAVQVAKTVADIFKKGTSFFQNLEKLSITDIGSITSIISLIIGLLPTQCDRSAPGGDTNTVFVPFLGSTECNFDESPLGSSTGGGSCGGGIESLNQASNVMNSIINEADPYLTAIENFNNGAYSAQFSTPGREGSLYRTADGTTIASIKANSGEYNKHKTETEAKAQGKKPGKTAEPKAKDTIAGLHIKCPNATSLVAEKDMHIQNRAMFSQTVDGDYKLKIVGNLDIEVGGRLAFKVNGAPQSVKNDGKPGDTGGKQRKNLIVFDSDVEISGRGKLETQGMGATTAAKAGTDQKLVTDNLSLNVPSFNINCSNDLKLCAGNAIYVETPSLIRNINLPPFPRVKSGIFTVMAGSYDMVMLPGGSAADAVPRFTVNNVAGPISLLVGATGFFVTVGAGVGSINVAAGALSLGSGAGITTLYGATAVSISSGGTIDLKAPLINLN